MVTRGAKDPGVGHQLLDMGEMIPHGSPQARFGLAFGQVLGGIVTLLGGVTGEVLGGIATTTGIGAAVGVPTIAVSTTFVVGGFANIAAGFQGLMTTGSGSGGSQAPPTSGAGQRVTGDALKAKRAEFNKAKPEFWKREAAVNPGKYSAEDLKLMQDGFAPTVQTVSLWKFIISLPSPREVPIKPQIFRS